MRCATCRKEARKRTAVYVVQNGTPTRHLVCSTCASQSMSIFVPVGSPAVCICGAPAAVTRCGACLEKKQAKPDELQRAIAKKLRALARAFDQARPPKPTRDADEREWSDGLHHSEGRVEGLNQAADLVEAWGRTNEARTS